MAVFLALVKQGITLRVIKQGVLENTPLIGDFPIETLTSSGFPS